MGISLLVIAMLLSIWAMTSVLHAREVSGGLTLPDCKDPCVDYKITSVVECLHLSGSTCETDRCTINNLRYMECTEGTAGCGETDCEYHKDYSDWWRSEYIRWHSCNSTTPASGNYGNDCAISGTGNKSWSTPCIWSGGCNGELWLYQTYLPPFFPCVYKTNC